MPPSPSLHLKKQHSVPAGGEEGKLTVLGLLKQALLHALRMISGIFMATQTTVETLLCAGIWAEVGS